LVIIQFQYAVNLILSSRKKNGTKLCLAFLAIRVPQTCHDLD
jgi:hypothetical protein